MHSKAVWYLQTELQQQNLESSKTTSKPRLSLILELLKELLKCIK